MSAVARIALLRHGHTAWNRAGRLQGSVDEPLDAEARNHLAEFALPSSFQHAALCASPLRRAVETATILAGRQPDIVPELVEMSWGEWEGRRGVDLLADPGSGYRHIEDWGWQFCPPGGETPMMVWERLQGWLGSVEGPVVAVTHVGVMRVLLARATGWDFAGPAPFKVKRDRLYVVTRHADGRLAYDGEPQRLVARAPA